MAGMNLSKFLWGKDPEVFNKLGFFNPYLRSFVFVQVLRLLSMITLLILWILNLYIFTRRAFVNLTFWTLTLQVATQGYIFVAAGRAVVEQIIKKKRGQLLASEKSTYWRRAYFLYNMTVPLVLTSCILYWSNPVTCFTSDIDSVIKLLGGEWRYNTYTWTIILQISLLSVEFLINAQGMKYKHTIFPVMFIAVYLLITWTQQAIFNQAAYTKLNWNYAFSQPAAPSPDSTTVLPATQPICASDTDPNPWNNFWMIVVFMTGLCIACQLLFTMLSDFKGRWFVRIQGTMNARAEMLASPTTANQQALLLN